jgi:RNA polymerase sigma factor (sigma-70 family)
MMTLTRPSMADPSVREYLRAISRFPLLRPDQEIELGRQIRARRDLLAEPPEVITAREKRIIRVGLKAREKFINSNLLLVVRFVKRLNYRRHTLSFMDLIQEGNIGLHKAVDKFDHEKGYKFSTYAFWWVRQACQRAIHRDDLMIALPLSHQAILGKVAEARDALGGSPTRAQIAARIGIPLEEMEAIVGRSQFVGSLDAPLPGVDTTTTRADTLEDPRSFYDLEGLDTAEQVERLGVVLEGHIEPRAREILLARYGDSPVSWADLSMRYGLPRARLQAIERATAAQVRRALRGEQGASIAAAAPQQTEQLDALALLY